MKILGYNIPIEFKEPSLSSNDWGSFKLGRGTIEIDNTLPQDVKEETVLHEVLEAIDICAELKMEHRAITAMSAILYGIFKDNGSDISKWV